MTYLTPFPPPSIQCMLAYIEVNSTIFKVTYFQASIQAVMDRLRPVFSWPAVHLTFCSTYAADLKIGVAETGLYLKMGRSRSIVGGRVLAVQNLSAFNLQDATVVHFLSWPWQSKQGVELQPDLGIAGLDAVVMHRLGNGAWQTSFNPWIQIEVWYPPHDPETVLSSEPAINVLTTLCVLCAPSLGTLILSLDLNWLHSLTLLGHTL